MMNLLVEEWGTTYETDLLKKIETGSDPASGSNFKGQKNVLNNTMVV